MAHPEITRLGSGAGERVLSAEHYAVLSGSPDPRSEAAYADPAGRLKAGVAIYRPSTVRLDGYPYDEYCFMLEGELRVTSAAGAVETFGPGDAFLLPCGFHGTWAMPNGIRKYYVVFDPFA